MVPFVCSVNPTMFCPGIRFVFDACLLDFSHEPRTVLAESMCVITNNSENNHSNRQLLEDCPIADAAQHSARIISFNHHTTGLRTMDSAGSEACLTHEDMEDAEVTHAAQDHTSEHIARLP